MNATPAMSKKIRNLAAKAYDEDGCLRGRYAPKLRGSYRAVKIEDDFAIKFAWNDSFAAHNRVEWDAWRSFPKSVQAISAKPFCISSCGRVMAVELVATTVDRRGGEFWEELSQFNQNLKDLLKASGFEDEQIRSLMVDNHGGNVGVRDNGDLCWIDYAGYAD